MPERLRTIADSADAIYNGFAFTLEEGRVRVINLENPTHASVIRADGEVIETSMDDIEIALMLSYYARVTKYLAA